MGERSRCGACPSPAGFMHILGISIGVCGLLLDGLLVLRGALRKVFRLFPVFYSYIVFALCGSVGMYAVYLRFPRVYPSAYWIYYLVTILAEFTVLIEISDQIFRSFTAIRNLGRALTIAITAVLGLLYILPAILASTHRRMALLDFALRAAITKAVILAVLFYVARHYGSEMGRNVSGLVVGFSIYLAMNITWLTAGRVFQPSLSTDILWVMGPLGFALCALVWIISLWDVAPVPDMSLVSTAARRDADAVALELTRLDNQLSKLLHK